jgi:uncharacterized membrane protein YphA (DoxX/SURF4 family)
MSLFLLRVALAFSFLYPAYGFWARPGDWIGYVPAFVKNIGLPSETILLGFALFHITLALWILIGWRTTLAASVAAFFLASVVLFNLNQLDILFRDIALALAALGLALGSRMRE